MEQVNFIVFLSQFKHFSVTADARLLNEMEIRIRILTGILFVCIHVFPVYFHRGTFCSMFCSVSFTNIFLLTIIYFIEDNYYLV